MTSTQDEQLRDAVKAAYIAGAMAVHNYWLANPGEAPQGDDPEFGEAASDYAASLPAPDTAGEVVADEHSALVAAGFDDYAARCALRTEPDGGFCHAYLYSDGQWRFQTGGSDLHQPDGKVLQCVLIKRLYAAPQAPATGGDAGLILALTQIANMGYAGAPDIAMRRIARNALAALNPTASTEEEGV